MRNKGHSFIFMMFTMDNSTKQDEQQRPDHRAIEEAADVYNLFVERSVKRGTPSQQRANTQEADKEAYRLSLGKAQKVKDVELVRQDYRPIE